MKMKKRWMAALMAAVMSLSFLTGCGSATGSSDTGSEESETTVLKMGHVYAEDYPMHIAMQEMSDYIYENTDGRYQIDLYANSTLGGESDLIEGVNIGTVDMCFTASTPLANTVPAISYLDLPFLIQDYDHADAVFFDAESPIRASIMGDIDAAGFKTLTLMENGFRQLFTNKDVQAIEDLKGLKIRVMENALHLELWEALGASPTTMSASEALTGLQQGTIDAMEVFNTAAVANGYAEMVSHYVETNHIYTCGVLLMSSRVWNSLSPEDQAVFEEAALLAMDSNNQELREADEAEREFIINDLVDTHTALNQGQLREMVQSVYDGHPEYDDMVEQIQALAG
ncbi:TRAP transporter substrate-binding protein [Dysosmobacter sp. Phy]